MKKNRVGEAVELSLAILLALGFAFLCLMAVYNGCLDPWADQPFGN